ncbi:MAG: PilZ domain-containing protein [Tepidisphaeraceae bacterium]
MTSTHSPESHHTGIRATVSERRQHRRHDLDSYGVEVQCWDGARAAPFGRLVDMSSGGMLIRTRQANIQADQQIRLKVRLPAYAGISPFVDTSGERIRPRTEWVGWMSVARVKETQDGDYEIGGRLVDMETLDRGMLSLYLSTQPLA